MARYGALTALQAALLGISGGAQGLVQAREREQKEGERRKQFEREELRDQREIARDEAERKYREAQLRQQADELAQRGILTREEIASREKTAGMTAGSAAAERALRERELDAKRKELQDEAVAWWNQTVIRSPEEFAGATPARKAAAARAGRTFNRLREGQPGADARELITATYAADQAYQLQRSREQQKNPLKPIPEEVPSGYLPPERGVSRGGPMAMSFPAPAGGQRKPFMDRLGELKTMPGMTSEKAKAQMASEGYDVINMR